MLTELCEGSEEPQDGNHALPKANRLKYTGSEQRFLESLYEGLNPNNDETRLERCCRFLGVEAPSCETGIELDGSYRIMEHEAIKRHFEKVGQPVP